MALGACSIVSLPTAAAPAQTLAPGTEGATPAAPAVATASVATPPRPVHVSLVVHRHRLNVGEGAVAWVRGTLRRAPHRERVLLQRRARHGWTTIARDRTDGHGRYRLRFHSMRPGSLIVRVRFAGATGVRPAARRVGRLNIFRNTFASWYGPGFYGHRTACGTTFSANVMGVANRTLPCGTRLFLRHGERTVRVQVIDRGPFNFSREFDLSPAVKRALGFGSTGTLGATV
jgi:hypothetical protein